MEMIDITAVDLDGSRSLGYYIDADGILQSVGLSYGEALAIQRALVDGLEVVTYPIEQ